MIYDGVIEGKYVDLRSATVDDAEFTLAIRQEPEFIKFLPRLNNTLEQQKNWIQHQRSKENDYFFVIWDKQGQRIGTISLYDVEENSAEGGRLAVRGNSFQSIEAQMLSFQFAFDILHLKEVVSYIYADNERALRFNKQFGGQFYETKLDANGHLLTRTINTKEKFEKAAEKLSAILYRESKE